jgi:hypothetical protein
MSDLATFILLQFSGTALAGRAAAELLKLTKLQPSTDLNQL